ncbi:nuclear transport factor 2 family protein [Nocardiopsis potens]|uniref:nuclear transport factor 2 family protein n=1 Tax=Nocardiopsis potens TaxID=1246458 RepID=UPI00034ADD31|nr:nuclear transport factor 2 family protein [Nocardiopsis potens]
MALQEAQPFDDELLRHAIEDGDVDAMLGQFTEDADLEMIDRRTPPSAPMTLHGRQAIGEMLRDVYSRPMTHRLDRCVVQGDHVAYEETCTYPDGTKVTSMSMLELSGGRIARQISVQAWDEGITEAEVADFADPEEVRRIDLGRVEVLHVGGGELGRAVFEPGWRWSTSVKPVAGTELCMFPHFGYVESGALRIRMADGTEFDAKAGQVARIPPGHDAWVLGDEPVVLVDWQDAPGYAQPSE